MEKNKGEPITELLLKTPYSEIMNFLQSSSQIGKHIRFKHLRILFCENERHKITQINDLTNIYLISKCKYIFEPDKNSSINPYSDEKTERILNEILTEKKIKYKLKKVSDDPITWEVEETKKFIDLSEIKPIITGKYQVNNLWNFLNKLIGLNLIESKKDNSSHPHYALTLKGDFLFWKSGLHNMLDSALEILDNDFNHQINKEHKKCIEKIASGIYTPVIQNMNKRITGEDNLGKATTNFQWIQRN